MPTDAQTTKPATDALTDLVDTARTRRNRAADAGLIATARTYDEVAQTLDGARTRLVEDGIEYLESAWAFVDAGRKFLAGLAAATPILDLIQTEARA